MIGRGIRRIRERHAQKKNESTQDTFSRRLAHATVVIAVLTAGIVAVGGLQYCTGEGQLQIMRGQLEEARKQRLATIAQSRAEMRWERPTINAIKADGTLAHAGDQIGGWIISPKWTNAGNTDAREWRAWFDLRAFIPPNLGYEVSKRDCPPSVPPDELPDGQTITNGGARTEYAKPFSLEDARSQANKSNPKYVLMWGHMEYRDIFFPETPQHYDDWCVGIVANDLIPDHFSFFDLMEKIQ